MMIDKKFKNLTIKNIVIEENDDFLAINKPPGLSTLEDRNSPYNVLSLAKETYAGAKVCHRLDKETSGVLIVAKSEEFYKYMSSLFEKRDVSKLYHTVVEGRHEFDELVLEKPIYSSQSKSRTDIYEGKPSITMVSTIDVYKNHSLLACMPFTGRLHQIRVHLADAGFPIVSDTMYGGNNIYLSQFKRNYKIGRGREEHPLIQRVALHAAAISFPDMNGIKQNIKATYPKDFAVLIAQLEKNKL